MGSHLVWCACFLEVLIGTKLPTKTKVEVGVFFSQWLQQIVLRNGFEALRIGGLASGKTAYEYVLWNTFADS